MSQVEVIPSGHDVLEEEEEDIEEE